ncbi:MAG: hypothetical protein UY42_C0001G0032 [Parcubacteria group bacterium GW2011_GWA2_49_16]|nr:MAG: hypothetical protein UY42_C0001G0032 [Parcubacteria group bacterium GW2011_GWA2_49_16]
MSIEAFPQKKEPPRDPAEMARKIALREIARNKERRASKGTVRGIPSTKTPDDNTLHDMAVDESVKYTHADHTTPKD